jgi:beta-glucosidase
MHGNRSLLTDVLKGRMGFQGFVVGDWDGHAQVPGCGSGSCAKAINAGLDMFMAPYHWQELYDSTLASARSGEISKTRLDDAVRRILRVKYKLGLFESARPFEGRLELVHSEAARTLGREAARKSLVLLQNDGVLPIRGSSKVLVTGPGAEDIAMQCGGWSVTWQSDDTTNKDYPGAETIKAALGHAVEAAGGQLVDGGDLTGANRPDVAIVVFGERPYAEMHGDIQIPLYNVGRPLEDLRRLKRAGIRTVSVFLSGRPLWVKPELESSNAFVAAWLPGTEAGGGIADVLVGDAQGKPRFDFTGRLSFAWPNGPQPLQNAAQDTNGRAQQGDTWSAGYGLSYKQASY